MQIQTGTAPWDTVRRLDTITTTTRCFSGQSHHMPTTDDVVQAQNRDINNQYHRPTNQQWRVGSALTCSLSVTFFGKI